MKNKCIPEDLAMAQRWAEPTMIKEMSDSLNEFLEDIDENEVLIDIEIEDPEHIKHKEDEMTN